MGGGTAVPLQELSPLYRAMKVKLVPGVLRRQSLDLFCHFFEHYSYWQDSLLAEYTLKQCAEDKL
jgi:tRNA(adenine34) deaminase